VKLISRQQDYNNPNSMAVRFRRSRANHLKRLISEVFDERSSCQIVDLGGSKEYWRCIDRDWLKRHRVHITIINLTDNIGLSEDNMFEYKRGDACSLALEDDSFDIAHSNSVIEHVGDWERMELFAMTTRRLAPRYYVQTPYFWFPIEPHFSALFIHWLPEVTRARLVMKRDLGFMPGARTVAEAMRSVQSARLLDKTMMRSLFPDAPLREERVLGLTKSLIAVRG
jgi:hypothetical protein